MCFFKTVADLGLRPGDQVDLAVTLDVNTYREIENLTVIIKDIKPSKIDQNAYFKDQHLYENIRRDEFDRVDESVLPTRDQVAEVYRFLKIHRKIDMNYEILLLRLGGLPFIKLLLALDMMSELGLIDYQYSMSRCVAQICQVSGKVDLEQSAVVRRIREQCKRG